MLARWADLVSACRAVPGVPVPEPASAVSDGGTTRWIRAGQLATPGVLTSVLEPMHRSKPAGSRIGDVVALAQGLSYAVAGPSAAGSYSAGLFVDANPEDVWFGFGGQGFCERLVVERSLVEPAVRGEFERRVAGPAVAILEPVFAQAHRVTRVGERVLWTALSDSVYQIMLGAVLPRVGALDSDGIRTELHRAWDAATAIVDAMAELVPALTSRPRAFPFTDDTISAMWLVRGGCCFVYREGPDIGYCVTCPVLDDEARRTMLLQWVKESGITGEASGVT